jgi:hypothetical protein
MEIETNDQTDWIIHPLTKYINNRPDWLSETEKESYSISKSKISEYQFWFCYRKMSMNKWNSNRFNWNNKWTRQNKSNIGKEFIK